jgi:hypothetical protein
VLYLCYNYQMKKLIILFFFSAFYISVSAQEMDNGNRGTIKIQKKGQLVKIQFDDVNYRLIGIDQYGNVLDSAVVEFQLSVTVKGIFYSEKTVGFGLSYQMQQLLGKCDRTSKIFFENIKAKDRNGTFVDMPKFQYTFGYLNENNE